MMPDIFLVGKGKMPVRKKSIWENINKTAKNYVKCIKVFGKSVHFYINQALIVQNRMMMKFIYRNISNYESILSGK